MPCLTENVSLLFEPSHEKTGLCDFSYQVKHKPVCATKEDNWELEILYLRREEIVLSV